MSLFDSLTEILESKGARRVAVEERERHAATAVLRELCGAHHAELPLVDP